MCFRPLVRAAFEREKVAIFWWHAATRNGFQDIILAVNDIRADTATMDCAAFAAQPSIIRSVLYSIAVIGAAAKNISPASKAAYPDIT